MKYFTQFIILPVNVVIPQLGEVEAEMHIIMTTHPQHTKEPYMKAVHLSRESALSHLFWWSDF